VWLMVSFPADLDIGQEKVYWLKETKLTRHPDAFHISQDGESLRFASRYYTLTLTNPGHIRLETTQGVISHGQIDFDVHADSRSAVGGQRPVSYEPRGFEILDRGERRVKVLLSGWYRARRPKSFDIDEKQRYDVELEITLFADSPVIRMQWRITDHMRFNCSYMWLDRYVMQVPVGDGYLVSGDEVAGENKCASWATVETPGGKLSMVFPMWEWLGKGAGVEFKDGKLGHGGINPPPDGGFGAKDPEIYRKFFYGMSRTFDGAIVVGGAQDQIDSELKPLPMILEPMHYSRTKQLPEGGDEINFGPWKDVVDRAAEWLIPNQWKGTLWFGEWWREVDVEANLGVEETHSGNSPLGPLYHFYRTGDWRFWEAAKMSYYYTFDCQFCKREDGEGPYMHTRRFMLDHQEWFHPRYQRVGGVIRPSHVFGHRRMREKIFWYLRYWAERYIDTDGAPILPERDGTMQRADERAMSNIAESLMYAWVDTRDDFFLSKARNVGDWIVNSFSGEDFETMAENSNSTRYILRGLIFLCNLLDDPNYKETYIKIAEWTAKAPRYDYGTHYVTFHFYYGALAYKMGASKQILYDLIDLAKWCLSMESKENPGTYPFPQHNNYPDTTWICSYDNQGLTAYLPALTAVCAKAGVPVE
ncbi:MAG: hypothetical protein WCL39_09665, partial [Armatimonadota bacterium]